jgi:nucleotide-binding universal stress UspA family protein
MSVKRILCGTTPGKGIDMAIRSAHQWAQVFGAELSFLHVIPPTESASLWSPLFQERPAIKWMQKVTNAHDEFIKRVYQELGENAKDLDIDLEFGSFLPILLKRAKAIACDMIVLADNDGNRRNISSERIIRHACCPALLARPETGEGKVLAATDLSYPTLPAVQMAAEAALRFHKSLSVIHCLDLIKCLGASYTEAPSLFLLPSLLPKGEIEELCRLTRQRLQNALHAVDMEGEMIVSQEPAFFAIADQAISMKADLVVVGAHNKNCFSRWAMGSVAESVVRGATCSVMTVPLNT